MSSADDYSGALVFLVWTGEVIGHYRHGCCWISICVADAHMKWRSIRFERYADDAVVHCVTAMGR